MTISFTGSATFLDLLQFEQVALRGYLKKVLGTLGLNLPEERSVEIFNGE